MGPVEIVGRVRDVVRRRRWRTYLDTAPDPAAWLPGRAFHAPLPADALLGVSPDALSALRATADRLMDGRAEYFGVTRSDLVSPDWALDPKTGRRAPTEAYAFDIPYRDEGTVGDIKQLWEPSRHHHLTVLAAAYTATGEERYAHRVADHLKSWWAANPPMRGVHWLSGIELGIRLLSWVWVRRLLDGWAGAPGLFEDNPEAVHQILCHQRWLAAFPSRGSSGNNHLVAELAGQLAASCAFPWFPESARWRSQAVQSLDSALRRNTFESGLNRELATEYHGLVMELGLAAAVEADAAGVPVPASTWEVLARMGDALAAVVDETLRPPRQGDADDGHGLVVDGDATDRWGSLLATGEALFGRLPWWPSYPHGDLRTVALAALTGFHQTTRPRPQRRPAELADAGMTILRVPAADGQPEIWCRCDAGPHGFLSIAAHAHADALSIEVRHGGVDVLADPGTYCYHGEPQWRRYFRSTLGHNTLEIEGADQSVSGGPFLWIGHARSRRLGTGVASPNILRWSGEHEGYSRRRARVVHRRSVQLGTDDRVLRVVDELATSRATTCRLAFHLGSEIAAELDGALAQLRWTAGGRDRSALLALPEGLSWTLHRGEPDPPLGWYSAGFGRKEPAVVLIGHGRASTGHSTWVSELMFGDVVAGAGR
jgi:hypothetical protein